MCNMLDCPSEGSATMQENKQIFLFWKLWMAEKKAVNNILYLVPLAEIESELLW